MTSRKTCLSYARLSFERGDEQGAKDGANVTHQLKLAREHAEKRGWSLIAEHRDDATSAYKKTDRKGFRALIEDIKADKADAVILRDIDRATRNRADTGEFLDACKEHDVLISTYFGQDYDLNSPAGMLLAEIISSVSRMESDQKAARQREMHKRRKAAGKMWGPVAPYGLTRDGKVIPEQAARINKAIDEILDGRSMRSITEEWTREGVKTSRGGDWRQSTLSNYLRSPSITGLMSDRTTEASWEKVVERGTWELLQAFLDDPSRKFGEQKYRGRGRSERLLAGLAVDEQDRIVGTGKSSNGGYTVYRTRTRNDAAAPKKVSRKAEDCDEKVISEVLTILTSPLLDKIVYKSGDERESIDRLRGELAKVARTREELAQSVAEGEMSLTDMRAVSKALEGKEDTLRADLAKINRTNLFDGLDLWGKNLTAAAMKYDDHGLRAWWDGMNVNQQRAILQKIFSKIVIMNGRGVPVRCIIRDDLS